MVVSNETDIRVRNDQAWCAFWKMKYISNKCIKELPEKIKIELLRIFNLSIHKQQIPSHWKNSTISMLFKKGDRKDLNNYRPISIISTICRLLDKIIRNRITNHIIKEKTIIKQQSGFRKNRSTKDNLVFLTQKVSEAIGKKQKLVAIFFEISI